MSEKLENYIKLLVEELIPNNNDNLEEEIYKVDQKRIKATIAKIVCYLIVAGASIFTAGVLVNGLAYDLLGTSLVTVRSLIGTFTALITGFSGVYIKDNIETKYKNIIYGLEKEITKNRDFKQQLSSLLERVKAGSTDIIIGDPTLLETIRVMVDKQELPGIKDDNPIYDELGNMVEKTDGILHPSYRYSDKQSVEKQNVRPIGESQSIEGEYIRRPRSGRK